MRAALLQMTGGVDPAANADTLVKAIHRAAGEGATMVFTPEMSNLVDRDRSRAATAITVEAEDRVLAAVRDAAARTGVWISLGSIALAGTDGRFVNRGFVIDCSGGIRARYDKLHLFDVTLATGEQWRESAAFAPGDAAVVVDTPLGRLGLSICYDVRFPDLYRALADAGAQLVAVPAAFTRPTGAAHWEVLLRARAIETGSYVLAAAQTGNHADGRTTWGHSVAIDPWGRVLADMGEAPGLALVEIEPALVADARTRIPVAAHRRTIPEVTLA